MRLLLELSPLELSLLELSLLELLRLQLLLFGAVVVRVDAAFVLAE